MSALELSARDTEVPLGSRDLLEATMSDILARYPTYGSCRKGAYRITGPEPAATTTEVARACMARASSQAPRLVFESFEHLGAGWEWSVFRDGHDVIKVPAGVFEETADPRYLENTADNYAVIRRYVEPRFLAETHFSAALPNIRQPCLAPLPSMIPYAGPHAGMWRAFFEQLLALLLAEDWCVELQMHLSENGFTARNLRVDESGTLKLIDFTAYIDVFRLYEERTRREIEKTAWGLRWMCQRLSEPPA